MASLVFSPTFWPRRGSGDVVRKAIAEESGGPSPSDAALLRCGENGGKSSAKWRFHRENLNEMEV
jgi:hypothetical protein